MFDEHNPTVEDEVVLQGMDLVFVRVKDKNALS